MHQPILLFDAPSPFSHVTTPVCTDALSDWHVDTQHSYPLRFKPTPNLVASGPAPFHSVRNQVVGDRRACPRQDSGGSISPRRLQVSGTHRSSRRVPRGNELREEAGELRYSRVQGEPPWPSKWPGLLHDRRSRLDDHGVPGGQEISRDR